MTDSDYPDINNKPLKVGDLVELVRDAKLDGQDLLKSPARGRIVSGYPGDNLPKGENRLEIDFEEGGSPRARVCIPTKYLKKI